MNKKELQKTIKMIRAARGVGEYPKAMMTAAQENKRTATINCGGRSTAPTLQTAESVLADANFKALLQKYDASAYIEQTGTAAYPYMQIRIEW